MTNLSKLRAAIIEAVPEIVELKPGCQVMLGDYDNGVVVAEIGICHRHKTWAGCQNYEGLEECEYDDGVHIAFVSDEGYSTIDKKTSDIADYNILGRPITLADVLRAVGMKKSIYLKTLGEQLRLVDESGGELEWWDLTKNLDDQSPETIDFLTSVLCK